jgi:ABC-type nitrate/sulfonate/bicarbonate transport system permease component
VLIGVFIIGTIGLLFEIAITALERRVLHWQSKA